MSRGKRPELSASQRQRLLELHDAGTQKELAELFSVSRTTRGHSLVMTVPGSMRHNGDASTNSTCWWTATVFPWRWGLSAAKTHDSMLLEQVVDAVVPVGRWSSRPAPASARQAAPGQGLRLPRCHMALRCRASGPGSRGVASSPASGLAATSTRWSGRWRGWWAAGG